MCHLGWPTRTGCHRGPEQRESQSRVRAGTPSAIVLIKKLRPIRRDHKRRGVIRHYSPSSAGGPPGPGFQRIADRGVVRPPRTRPSPAGVTGLVHHAQ